MPRMWCNLFALDKVRKGDPCVYGNQADRSQVRVVGQDRPNHLPLRVLLLEKRRRVCSAAYCVGLHRLQGASVFLFFLQTFHLLRPSDDMGLKRPPRLNSNPSVCITSRSLMVRQMLTMGGGGCASGPPLPILRPSPKIVCPP